jgi:hypothetical protein
MDTIHLFFAAQGYLIAPLLLLGGVTKFLASKAEIDRTGVGELVRRLDLWRLDRAAQAVWLAIACLEVGLASLIALSVWPLQVGIAGGVLTVFLLPYLAWLLRTRQSASCGCFGTSVPVTWKSFARTSLLAGMFAAYAASGYLAENRAPSGTTIAVVLFEGTAIAALSDELRPWLRRGRLAVARLARPIGVLTTAADVVRQRIEDQPFWYELVAGLGNTPEFRTAWREDRWYLVEYHAVWSDADLLIVGAEYLGIHPPWLRIVVAREHEHDITLVTAWDSVVAAQDATLTPPGTLAPTFSGA